MPFNLLSFVACQSVGGSEGFAIQEAILLHQSGTEVVQEAAGYERRFEGTWMLLAWGGGRCSEALAPQEPEGDGWEVSDGTDGQTLCEIMRSSLESIDSGPIFINGNQRHRRGMTLYISDLPEESNAARGYLQVADCAAPTPDDPDDMAVGYGTEVVLAAEITDYNIAPKGDQARIEASYLDKIKVDITLPVCTY